nr:MAG TPA: hypothetical protein [Caudoviricetes sp.]
MSTVSLQPSNCKPLVDSSKIKLPSSANRRSTNKLT